MITQSAFEVLGPIMVGPSSSHTAGALRIASVARSLAPRAIREVRFTLYASFARTHQGHGTDRALVAGMLGLETDDPRIRDSFALAHEAGLMFSFVEDAETAVAHPNTVDIALTLEDGSTLTLRGESVGGGRVRISQIEGVEVDVSGEYVTLFVQHRDMPGVIASVTTAMATFGANIAAMRNYRTERGGTAYTVLELDEAIDDAAVELIGRFPDILMARLVSVPGTAPTGASTEIAHGFADGASLLAACREHGCSIGALMHAREAGLLGSADEADRLMERVLEVLRAEVRATIDAPEPSLGGFLHGQARAVFQAGPMLLGAPLARATAYAMAVLERSAAMGVIVAAPTAGSAGVVPGALLGLAEERGLTDAELTEALWCAAAIGAIVGANASVSGAEGGCQAEVGTASAMAAAALAQMHGCDVATCLDAAALALGNIMGLACDPARGLVEYPCQNRNAIGVANAFTAAQLALAGVRSAAPFDEVVAATAAVGRLLPSALRETAEGGLARCPSVCGDCAECGACA